jgi:hypothetical protein
MRKKLRAARTALAYRIAPELKPSDPWDDW